MTTRAQRLATPLLRWYDGAARALPWRQTTSPYRTLVSEFMAQQTVLATVIPYFERFMKRFPDLATLAAATEDDVTAMWSGLGYYARARNLHKAARAVVEHHAGALPATEDELRALPGIGPYTAAAVAAIAFEARAFALDGNGARVLARLFDVADAIDLPATRAALHARGLAEVPAARPGDFNQAVMELGATICGPRTPLCEACPVAKLCRARAAGTVDQLPARTPKRAKRAVRVACCACVDAEGRVLLVRRGAGLLAGTWALPGAEIDGDAGDTARAAVREAGVRTGPLALRGNIRHVFTHRDVTADVFRARATTQRARDGGATRRWLAPEDLRQVGVSTFTRKTLEVALGTGRAARKRDKADASD